MKRERISVVLATIRRRLGRYKTC